MNNKNYFLELVKDLSSYPKNDILILSKKYNIPFVNKNVAINIIAQPQLSKVPSATVRL